MWFVPLSRASRHAIQGGILVSPIQSWSRIAEFFFKSKVAVASSTWNRLFLYGGVRRRPPPPPQIVGFPYNTDPQIRPPPPPHFGNHHICTSTDVCAVTIVSSMSFALGDRQNPGHMLYTTRVVYDDILTLYYHSSYEGIL